MQLFAQNGYRGASIGDIEKAVGLAPRAGGFYRHFRSKEEILLTAMDEYEAEINLEISELSKLRLKSPFEELERLVIMVRDHAARHRHIRTVLRRDGRSIAKVRARIRRFNQADAWVVFLDWTARQLGKPTVDDEVRLHTFQIFSTLALMLYLQDNDEKPLGLDPDVVLHHWLKSAQRYVSEIVVR